MTDLVRARGEVVASRPLGAYQCLSLVLPHGWGRRGGEPAGPGQFVVFAPADAGVLPDSWWVSGVSTDDDFGVTVECVLEPGEHTPGPGDPVSLLGPPGRGFSAPSPTVPVAVVGHEAGGAPATWWAQLLRRRGCEVTLVLSATDPDRQVDVGQARRCADEVLLTTPADLGEALTGLGGQVAVCYAVTPLPLSEVVSRVAAGLGVPSQVTAYEPGPGAGCGVGLCGACEVPLAAPGGRPVRPCVDGPVLRGDQVSWHQWAGEQQ